MPILAPISMLTASYAASTLTTPSLDRIGKVFLWTLDIVLLVIGLGLAFAYFYLKRAYLLNTPPGFSVLAVAISMLVTAFTLAGGLYLQRRKLARYWISTSLSIILVYIFTLTAIVPILDKHKSFVPFCMHVTALVPADQPLYGYKPDETLRGAVPFYTKRSVIEIEEIESDLLARREPFFIIIRDKKEKLERELLSSGNLFVLEKQMMGIDRTLVLVSNRAHRKK
jgi:hypothetical protein